MESMLAIVVRPIFHISCPVTLNNPPTLERNSKRRCLQLLQRKQDIKRVFGAELRAR